MVGPFWACPPWDGHRVAPQAAKELSKAFSSAAKTAMPAVVSIKVEKTITGPGDGHGRSPEFNDPFGQFPDDFRRRFFGGRAPQRSPPEVPPAGAGVGLHHQRRRLHSDQ